MNTTTTSTHIHTLTQTRAKHTHTGGGALKRFRGAGPGGLSHEAMQAIQREEEAKRADTGKGWREGRRAQQRGFCCLDFWK